MTITCLFCDKNVKADEPSYKHTTTLYLCKRCGHIHLTQRAADYFPTSRFSQNDKTAISITLRNEWERRGRKQPDKELTLDDLRRIVAQFRPLDPLEKMDHALITIDKTSRHFAQSLKVQISYDYPLYFCSEPDELNAILRLLFDDYLVLIENIEDPSEDIRITSKG